MLCHVSVINEGTEKKVVGCTCLGWFIISGKANAINTYNLVMISISPIVMTLGWFMKLGLPSPLKFTSRGQGQLASCRFFWFIFIYHILNMSLACMLGTCSAKRNLCCKQMLLCHLPAFSSVCLDLLSLFAATLTQSEGCLHLLRQWRGVTT